MTRSIIALLLLTGIASAKSEKRPDVSANPAVERALERRKMASKVRVTEQEIKGGEVISHMSDGSVVKTPITRAVTARITPSARDVREVEVAALAVRLGADPADPRAVAAAIKKHQDDLDGLAAEAGKSKGQAGALGALAGLALGAAGAVAAAGKATGKKAEG